MKKVLSFALALTLLLTMSITVFAEEPAMPDYTNVNDEPNILADSNQGTIQITNATVGQTYTVYKILGAEMAADKEVDSTTGVNYIIDPESDAYDVLFGADNNPCFNYDTDSHHVTLKNGITTANLVTYFNTILSNPDNLNKFPHVSLKADATTVKFTHLQYGYYMISSTLGSTATLNSNTPSVAVIDKNQIPTNFDKKVKKASEDDDQFADSNTVNVGDIVTYKIAFNATNYAGQDKIRYYQVFDNKGTAIWAEFNSFQVIINGDPKPGYYLRDGGINTGDWAELGTWDEGETPSLEKAEWYLVHTDFDEYSILIPWLDGHTVKDVENNKQEVSVPIGGNFLYPDSPTSVEIRYTAVVEPNADIGTSTNLFNTAELKWALEFSQGTLGTDTVTSETYGLTILKLDSSTRQILPGAKFKVYRRYNPDAAEGQKYSDPVYVIPTGIAGVYALDSADTAAERVTGTHKQTTRKYYATLKDPNGNELKNPSIQNKELAALYHRDAFGNILKDENDKELTIKTNEVETQVNGRLVIVGLDEGTYYLEETDPPSGYNKLTTPVEVRVVKSTGTTGTGSSHIYTDADGNVLPNSAGSVHMYTYSVTEAVVGNSRGAALPNTGGEGRIMLITVGSMLAMFFAVLLITQKKMSIYKD